MIVRVLRSMEVRVVNLVLFRDARDPRVIVIRENQLDETGLRQLFWPADEQDAMLFLSALRYAARANIPYRVHYAAEGGFVVTNFEATRVEVQSHRTETLRMKWGGDLPPRGARWSGDLPPRGASPANMEFPLLQTRRAEEDFRRALPAGLRTILERTGERPGAVSACQTADRTITFLSNEEDLAKFADAYLRLARESIGRYEVETEKEPEEESSDGTRA